MQLCAQLSLNVTESARVCFCFFLRYHVPADELAHHSVTGIMQQMVRKFCIFICRQQLVVISGM